MSKAPKTPVAAPTTVTPGWRMSALTFWWSILAAAVVVSSIGNIVRAFATAPEGWQTVAAWIGGGLPVTLMLLIEGIAIAERGGASGRARIVGLTILIPLLGIVLGNSYIGLLVVAEKTGHLEGHPVAVGFGYGLTAVPDMLMVAATAYLMAFRSRVVKTTSTGRWSRIGGALGDRVEGFIAPKPTPSPTPVTPSAPTTVWAPSWEPEPTQADTPVTTPAPTSPTPPPMTSREPASAAAAPGTAEGAEGVVPESPRPVGAEGAAPVEVSAPATTPLPELPEPTADDIRRAQIIVADGVTALPVEKVATTLAALAQGMSARGIRKAGGPDPTIVGRIKAAAEALPVGPRMALVSGGDR